MHREAEQKCQNALDDAPGGPIEMRGPMTVGWFALRKLRPTTPVGVTSAASSGRDEAEEAAPQRRGPSTDTPSTWSPPAASLKGGAAVQPGGGFPGLTSNTMNSVNTSPST
jgi:hypothetical protein